MGAAMLHNKQMLTPSCGKQAFAILSKQVLVEILNEKSINEKEVAAVVEEEEPTWMTPIVEYLRDRILPEDSKDASKLRIKARQYELLQGVLYRRSFLKLWLRCVRPLQADYVIREIHEGSCSLHAGPRSMVAKAMCSGYYWPTMHRDTRETIRKCKDCQIHRPVPREPQQPLTPITAPWSFYKWGIDIAGPFPEGGDPFKDWCEKLNIVQRFVSIKHPQSNGLVERENTSLGEGIKARLGENNKNWLEELPHVLWAHRTTIKSSNDDTLFSLTYGTEAVIPAEIGMPTYGEERHCSEKPELNDHMYNWTIAKYGKPNANWIDSLFDIIADDVWKTFFDQPEHAKDVKESSKTDVQDVAKIDVQDVAPTAVVGADQGQKHTVVHGLC
ncbi:reverse transcriptase domain-containing protein [Tanacetum coccineum]